MSVAGQTEESLLAATKPTTSKHLTLAALDASTNDCVFPRKMPRKLPRVLLSTLNSNAAGDSAAEKPTKKQPQPHLSARAQRYATRCSQQAEPLNLSQLPTEILLKIIAKLDLRYHRNLRATSKRLLDISDTFIMHEFRKSLSRYASLNPQDRRSASLKVIHLATEAFIGAGFVSAFCGCILPLLGKSHDPFYTFYTHASHINDFLRRFYAFVTQRSGKSRWQRTLLLHNITLMRLLKKFDKVTVAYTVMPQYCRVVVKLTGPWLGLLWMSRAQPTRQPQEIRNLLAILSEMLIANIMGKDFKRVLECLDDIYVFGNDTSHRKRMPAVEFTFKIHGSKSTCALLCSCLEDGADERTWPTRWSNEPFTVSLDVMCQEATKLGCSRSQHMKFGPLIRPSDE